jgi:hypothetical protein
VQICGKRLRRSCGEPFSAPRVSHRFALQPQQPPVFIAKKKRLKNLLHCSRLEPIPCGAVCNSYVGQILKLVGTSANKISVILKHILANAKKPALRAGFFVN